MGLWLKCPGCQASIPLSSKACPKCGQDLAKLTANQRVYIIGPAAAPPAPSPPSTKAVVSAAPETEGAAQKSTPAPEEESAPKPAKKPKKAKKKKS